MKRDLKPIRDKLRNDKRCKRLHHLFTEMPVYKIPVDKLIKEVESIHATRSVRFLKTDDAKYIERVVEACVRDQSQRSRLTEIIMKCHLAEKTLSEALDKLREYLLMTYGQELGFVRTKEERGAVVRMALAPFHKFVHDVTTLKELCELVISDIDKAAWALKMQVSAYELHNRPERNI